MLCQHTRLIGFRRLLLVFVHRLPLFLGRRTLRPEALRQDEEAARLVLQRAGYPAAAIEADPDFVALRRDPRYDGARPAP